MENTNTTTPNNTALSLAITKALAYTENGGKPNINNPSAGKTGESASVFQFEPATWNAYSKQILGKVVPMTPTAEAEVTQKKVLGWLNDGYTTDQIASMWNAGPGEPDAYTGKFSDGTSSTGVNSKYGVDYNVPEYASKVSAYTEQFENELSSQQTQPQDPIDKAQSFLATVQPNQLKQQSDNPVANPTAPTGNSGMIPASTNPIANQGMLPQS